MDRKISIEALRDLLIIHPDISAEGLVDLANEVLNIFENSPPKEILTIEEDFNGYFKLEEDTINQQRKDFMKAMDIYTKNFWKDIEKLTKEGESNGKTQDVRE